MDELLLTVVVYELLLFLLVTNFFFLVAPKGAFCFSGCPVYRGLWGVRLLKEPFVLVGVLFIVVSGAFGRLESSVLFYCFGFPFR